MTRGNGSAGGDGTIRALDAPMGEGLGREDTGEVLGGISTFLQSKPGMRVASDALKLSRIDEVVGSVSNGNGSTVGAEDLADAASVVTFRVRGALDSLEREEGGLLRVGVPREASIGDGRADGPPRTAEGDDVVTADLRGLVRPLLEDELRGRRLDEKCTWHNEAMLRLQDLAARRNGLGPDSQALSADMEPRVAETTRDLVAEMSRNACEIAQLEADRRNWQASADAASAAIRLREETAAEAIGEALEPEPRPHLLLARARFRQEGNSGRLRRELEAARLRMPTAPSLA